MQMPNCCLRIAPDFHRAKFSAKVQATAFYRGMFQAQNFSVMMKTLEQLPAFTDGQKSVNVIIETPKGAPVKYSYRPESGAFYAKRLLPPGMVFPFNFGFIPSTLEEDGDPLDILLLNEISLACGCLVKACLVAVVNAEQTEHGKTYRNDRIVGAVLDEESPAEFLKLDLNQRRLSEIQFFFATYNRFSGKEFRVLGTGGPEQAGQLVRKGEKNWEASKRKLLQ